MINLKHQFNALHYSMYKLVLPCNLDIEEEIVKYTSKTISPSQLNII
jgi:hypothetical protein